MATVDELQKEHEARLAALLAELAGRGADSNLALVRALIHKGVHLAADQKAIEFCALATFLAEMIGHAHQLLHGATRAPPPTATPSTSTPARSGGRVRPIPSPRVAGRGLGRGARAQ